MQINGVWGLAGCKKVGSCDTNIYKFLLKLFFVNSKTNKGHVNVNHGRFYRPTRAKNGLCLHYFESCNSAVVYIDHTMAYWWNKWACKTFVYSAG